MATQVLAASPSMKIWLTRMRKSTARFQNATAQHAQRAGTEDHSNENLPQQAIQRNLIIAIRNLSVGL
jgi:hypothetical protein